MSDEKYEKVIIEARTFGNEEGKKVMAFVPINPKTLEVDTSRESIGYTGEAIVNSNRGPMPLPFEFPEGYTLEKCFEDFDIVATKEIDARIKADQERSRIITPDQMKGGKDNTIIMP